VDPLLCNKEKNDDWVSCNTREQMLYVLQNECNFAVSKNSNIRCLFLIWQWAEVVGAVGENVA